MILRYHRVLTIAVCLTTICIGYSHNAMAEKVTFEIRAVIDEISDPHNILASHLREGDQLNGSYTFNTNAPDTDSSPNYGYFNQVNALGNGFNLTINQLSTSLKAEPNRLFHSINTGDGNIDFYYIKSEHHIPMGKALTITFIGLEIFDDTGKVLSSDALSSSPPDIHGAQDKNILIIGKNNLSNKPFNFRAIITAFDNQHDDQNIAENLY